MGYHFHHESSDNTVNQFATNPRVWLSFIFGCSLLSGCFDAAGPSPPHSVRTGDVVLDNPDVTASAEELETERLGLLAGELACAEARYKNKTARTQAREAALQREQDDIAAVEVAMAREQEERRLQRLRRQQHRKAEEGEKKRDEEKQKEAPEEASEEAKKKKAEEEEQNAKREEKEFLKRWEEKRQRIVRKAAERRERAEVAAHKGVCDDHAHEERGERVAHEAVVLGERLCDAFRGRSGPGT